MLLWNKCCIKVSICREGGFQWARYQDIVDQSSHATNIRGFCLNQLLRIFSSLVRKHLNNEKSWMLRQFAVLVTIPLKWVTHLEQYIFEQTFTINLKVFINIQVSKITPNRIGSGSKDLSKIGLLLIETKAGSVLHMGFQAVLISFQVTRHDTFIFCYDENLLNLIVLRLLEEKVKTLSSCASECTTNKSPLKLSLFTSKTTHYIWLLLKPRSWDFLLWFLITAELQANWMPVKFTTCVCDQHFV